MKKFNLIKLLLSKDIFGITLPYFGMLVILFSSCKVIRPTAYFANLKKDTTLVGFITPNFETKIIKGDRISIVVSSLSNFEDALFNSAGSTSTLVAASSTPGGYTVQQDGTILLHRLGNTAVAGLTRKELSTELQTKLLPYMKEPIVRVNYLNHKITVLGQVANPQVLSMPEEQLSLIDALVLSGDVTANAKRNNITIIREEGTEKKIKHVNLEDNSIFSSPWYYVKPNDIILVSADTEKFMKEENRRKLQNTISLLASGISLVIIILSRVIK